MRISVHFISYWLKFDYAAKLGVIVHVGHGNSVGYKERKLNVLRIDACLYVLKNIELK